MKPTFVFCHGFGWDAHFWDNLRPHLTEAQGSYRVGVGHSLGFARLLNMDTPFDALVGLQGFTHFLGRDEILRSKRLCEWRAMKRQLLRDPHQTLQDFYARSHVAKTIDMINENQLIQDFSSIIAPSILRPIPTLILGATDDVVVPPALIHDNFDGCDNVTVSMHPTGGHDLGYHHADWVSTQIKDFVRASF